MDDGAGSMSRRMAEWHAKGADQAEAVGSFYIFDVGSRSSRMKVALTWSLKIQENKNGQRIL